MYHVNFCPSPPGEIQNSELNVCSFKHKLYKTLKEEECFNYRAFDQFLKIQNQFLFCMKRACHIVASPIVQGFIYHLEGQIPLPGQIRHKCDEIKLRVRVPAPPCAAILLCFRILFNRHVILHCIYGLICYDKE